MMTLYELLKREIRRMVAGTEKNRRGNIYPLVVGEIEKYVIHIVLEETKYNCVLAARMLGIGRSTLYRKMEEFNLSISKDNKIINCNDSQQC